MPDPSQIDIDLYTLAVYTANKSAKINRNSQETSEWLSIADALRPYKTDSKVNHND